MERIAYKNHKKFLSTLKFIIRKYSHTLIYNNNVKGFFFDIRGKVGVAGNAKKRHFSFNEGQYSKTTKNSKFDYQHTIIRTFTGALGVTFILYY
jgi:ribosomal protein S3